MADRPFPVSRRLLLRAAVLGPLAAALDAAARRAGAAPPARHTHRTIIGVI